MALEVFRHNDAGYERWLETHRDGYVLNACQTPTASYINAHHATCWHISVLPTGYTTWTAGSYIKIVADSIEELEEWTRHRVGAPTQRRCSCWA
jgi:hypothetical protein